MVKSMHPTSSISNFARSSLSSYFRCFQNSYHARLSRSRPVDADASMIQKNQLVDNTRAVRVGAEETNV